MRTIQTPALPLAIFALGCIILPPSASAAHRSCGSNQDHTVVQIQAVAISCGTARDVADQWYVGEHHTYVRDLHARRWTCRITERASGDDPGNPTRTRIRCAYSTAVIKFALQP